MVQIMPDICRENLFHTSKCKCLSLDVGIELSICEENRHLSLAQIQTLTSFETA